MKSSKNIVFLGMMGSGKTSIGFLISRKLKLDFFDIDNHIENNFGMKISKIFKDKGEKFFSEYEEKITLNILKQKKINSTKRPLAYNTSDIELKNMIKERSKIYSKALYKINCNNLNKTEIIDKIINIYETN